MRPPYAVPTRRTTAALSCLALVAGAIAAVSLAGASPAQAKTEFVQMPATASVKVHYRGNGHGHGMSQYGARGAADKGLSTKQILAFYYPGTRLTTLKASTIRVLLSGATASTTVLAGTTGLKLSGYRTLPATGYTLFRLVPSGSGLRLQGRKAGVWKSIKAGLPARADFSSSKGWVQLLRSDGTSTRYRGSVGAVRSGTGERTINRVSLDNYTQGVAPNEMPASWNIAAVRAQAIAARSYAKSSMDAAGSAAYDICDTTMCQVYGGSAHYDSRGHLISTDDPAAIAGNLNMVLTYRGNAIFAQYSASNGGATVDGGQPYLVGRTDPYDTAASGDPYLDQANDVSKSSLAGSYGLRSVSSIEVTKRDGHGPWGGRIQTAYVNGTTRAGHKAHLATTGFALGDAMGVYTDYLRVDSALTVPAKPSSAKAVPGDAGARISWLAPTGSSTMAITGYRVRFRGRTLTLPASARSTWVGPLSNLGTSAVTVQAVNAAGGGTIARLTATPTAQPLRVVAVAPKRLFDTRTVATTVDKTHPFRFAVPGHGSIPASGARSVQLTVTVLQPSASGVLTITSSGVTAIPLAAIAYRASRTATATVSVPLSPSGTLVFTPSAGHIAVWADQESYTASSGSLVAPAPRQTVATVTGVPTGRGAVLSLAGLTGISATTKGVLIAVDANNPSSTWLRVWPDGPGVPDVQHVAVTAYASKANTLIVPLGPTHKLRIAAGVAGTTARVTLLGTLGSAGGRFETFPASPIADDASPHAAPRVGTTPTEVRLVGVSQVPSSGVSAVLVQLTVRSTGAAGSLWAYPGGVATPAAPSVIFAGTGSATATALVRVPKSGTMQLKSSVSGVHVSVDAIGYVTKH